MPSLDRHIAISAGWVAGPAAGVAIMGAPTVLGNTSQMAAYVCFYGGSVVFVLTIIAVLVHSIRERGRGRAKMWPIMLMASGTLLLLLGTGAYFWPASKKTEIGTQGKEKSSTLLDYTIGLQCEQTGRPVNAKRTDGNRLNLIVMIGENTVPSGTDFGSFISNQYTSPDSVLGWPENDYASWYKCYFRNQGQSVISKIRIGLEFTVSRSIVRENQTTPGEILVRQIFSVSDTELRPGSLTNFFYIMNRGQLFVNIAIPKEAEILMPGSNDWARTKLIKLNASPDNDFTLFPGYFINTQSGRRLSPPSSRETAPRKFP